MRPAPGGGRRRAMPWGLIGMIALVVATERTLTRLEIDLVDPVQWDWRVAARSAARAQPSEVLCLGDSLTKMGLLPRVIRERGGPPTRNLGVMSGQAPATYFLLKRSLAGGRRPAALVVNYRPLALSSPISLNERQWPELLDLGEALDLAWAAGDARLFAATTLGHHLASYRARHDIRAGVVAALEGRSSTKRDQIEAHRRNRAANGGAVLLWKNPAFQDPVAPPEAVIPPGNWACDPVNAAYVNRFFALAAESMLPVYWLMTPESPGASSWQDRNGDHARIDRFARDIQDRYPNVVVVDGRGSGYPPGVFNDQAHLDREGSPVLSAGLAEVLARPVVATGPRWVELPPFAADRVMPSLESLDQSHLAYKAEKDRTRR